MFENFTKIKKSAEKKMMAIRPIILPETTESKTIELLSTYAIAVTIRREIKEKIQEMCGLNHFEVLLFESVLSAGL